MRHLRMIGTCLWIVLGLGHCSNEGVSYEHSAAASEQDPRAATGERERIFRLYLQFALERIHAVATDSGILEDVVENQDTQPGLQPTVAQVLEHAWHRIINERLPLFESETWVGRVSFIGQPSPKTLRNGTTLGFGLSDLAISESSANLELALGQIASQIYFMYEVDHQTDQKEKWSFWSSMLSRATRFQILITSALVARYELPPEHPGVRVARAAVNISNSNTAEWNLANDLMSNWDLAVLRDMENGFLGFSLELSEQKILQNSRKALRRMNQIAAQTFQEISALLADPHAPQRADIQQRVMQLVRKSRTVTNLVRYRYATLISVLDQLQLLDGQLATLSSLEVFDRIAEASLTLSHPDIHRMARVAAYTYRLGSPEAFIIWLHDQDFIDNELIDSVESMAIEIDDGMPYAPDEIRRIEIAGGII